MDQINLMAIKMSSFIPVIRQLEVMLVQQTTTYIKIRNLHQVAPQSKTEHEKIKTKQWTHTRDIVTMKLQIKRRKHVQCLGYR